MQSVRRLRKSVVLNPDAESPAVSRFGQLLRDRVVGQDRAVRSICSLYQVFMSGMTDPNRPIGAMLFLGPTGSGKTHVVETAAEILFGYRDSAIRIDCAEYQHSHEIAKLIGSPPGYLGHRETPPLLTDENLKKARTEDNPFTLILFDEIEKASDVLWQLLLGVLDKATLTLGDNRRVDFSQTMIFMTSNLGSKEMSELINGHIGFAPAESKKLETGDLDQKIYRTAHEAAKRRFSPEFMNRIDKVVVFRSLRDEQLRQILELELNVIQRRVDGGVRERFKFKLTDKAKDFLMAEGVEYRYGARHLKRTLERFLVFPLSNLSSTGQVRQGDTVIVDLDDDPASNGKKGLTFQLDISEVSQATENLERPQFFKQRN